MSKSVFAFATIGLVCAATGCAGRVEPAAKAASVSQLQCDGSAAASSAEDLRLLQHTTVLSARPLYSHVIAGKDNSEDRVTGAQLLIRPPEGVSAERLTRMLQCHSAQILLGQVDRTRFADDPYWLPNAWLDIQVKPEDGNFYVMLRADSVPDGLKVLHRATAFVDSHRTPDTAP